jgi:hypothetical protein
MMELEARIRFEPPDALPVWDDARRLVGHITDIWVDTNEIRVTARIYDRELADKIRDQFRAAIISISAGEGNDKNPGD